MHIEVKSKHTNRVKIVQLSILIDRFLWEFQLSPSPNMVM